MNKAYILLLTATISTAICSHGQVEGGNFQEFRKAMLNDFGSYRKSVLDNYASFLEGIWRDYECFRGEQRETFPKPTCPPVAVTPDKRPPVTVPPKNVAPSEVAKEPQNIQPHTFEKYFEFSFYGIQTRVPNVEIPDLPGIHDTKDFANCWRKLASKDVTLCAVKELRATADTLGLNDYLTFEFVQSWAEAVYKDAPRTCKASLTHYILNNMGYDVRLALTSNYDPILLIPCEQQVYGKAFLRIGSQRYYVFGTNTDLGNTVISTCDIPVSQHTGRVMDLRLKPLNLPYRPHHYSITHGSIKIEGDVNANIFPILYHYPQMSIADYAVSEIDPALRKSIVRQIRDQLFQQQPREKVNSLLQFVQNGFTYATDQTAHGFEKPYFFEEMLYYAACDCEDRALFYSYLLNKAFDLDCHIIHYPGHESVAVRLEDGIEGDHYIHDGAYFYVSDPTYIGATTGMCMPDFRHVTPEIDYKYTNLSNKN